jgi:magnesium-transporting ATPase (P-type)
MVNEKDKIAKEKWLRMKEQGRRKFIFRTGFLTYGMMLFVVYIILTVILNQTYNPEIRLIDYISSSQFLNKLLFTFVLFSLLGWFMGRSLWRSYQRKWDEVKKFNDNDGN